MLKKRDRFTKKGLLLAVTPKLPAPIQELVPVLIEVFAHRESLGLDGVLK